MNLFRSEKAPYIIGLLITLLGWHIAQLVEDVRSTKSVTYSVSVDDQRRRATAHLHNVSKTSAVVLARFTLACDPDVECLVRNTQEVSVREPHLISAADIQLEPGYMLIETSLAAGARLNFGAQLANDADRPRFYFIPSADNTQDIYLIPKWSLRGILVVYQLPILATTFVLLLGLLGFSLYALSLEPRTSTGGTDAKENTPGQVS